MRKLIVFLSVLVILVLLIPGCAYQETSPTETPAKNQTNETSLPPELFLDSDGDGFNDWFEVNIAHYDPNVPNDRYFILFYRMMKPGDPGKSGAKLDVDLPTQFLVEKGEVPSENIIKMTQEEATACALKDAIEQVAEKSDKNDLVYLQINAHGGAPTPLDVRFLADELVKYATVNEWLDQIEAKVVIASISSCGCEIGAPILKEGPYPRIIYFYAGGAFIYPLGLKLDWTKNADILYGNNDGYVSIGEMADCLDDDFAYRSDWNILRERRKMRKYPREVSQETVEVEGYYSSHMVDTSNIAYQTYLTDYKIPS